MLLGSSKSNMTHVVSKSSRWPDVMLTLSKEVEGNEVTSPASQSGGRNKRTGIQQSVLMVACCQQPAISIKVEHIPALGGSRCTFRILTFQHADGFLATL